MNGPSPVARALAVAHGIEIVPFCRLLDRSAKLLGGGHERIRFAGAPNLIRAAGNFLKDLVSGNGLEGRQREGARARVDNVRS
jgi:hypothetical protein